MRLDWDSTKARENLRKHGVSFTEASSVFNDDHGILLPDHDHSSEEERFVLIGLNSHLRLLVVVHAYKADADVIRIISARPASHSERAQYGAQRLR